MKITLVADSTFIFEHRGVRILTDPWIGTTIYGGAWRQFPPPVIAAADVGRLDFIFISHVHEDHCDPRTIAALDRNATVLLMDRNPDFVEGFLRRHGFNFRAIRKIPPYTRTELAAGIAVEVLDADPAHSLNHLIDSSLLLHWGDQAIYFANDNPPYARSIEHLKRQNCALAILPPAGGSGYPACFVNLTAHEKMAEKKRIVDMYFAAFTDALGAVRPKRFMASAGNHVVVGRGAALSREMTYLSSPMAAYRYVFDHFSPELHREVCPLNLAEGETWDAEGEVVGDPEAIWQAAMAEGDWQDRKRRFVAALADAPYDHDLMALPSDLDWRRLFLEAGGALLRTAAKSRNEFRSHLYIDLPAAKQALVGHIDGASRTVEVLAADAPRLAPYLEVSSDPTLVYQLLCGRFSWNIADAAGFLRYRRVPNHYDQQAVIALNYLRQPATVGSVEVI